MKVRVLGILPLLVLSLCVSIADAKIEVVLGNVRLKQNINLPNAMPEADGSEIIISRDQYVISYNKERRTPNWVSWKLEASDIGSVPRTNIFLKDADLSNYLLQSTGTDSAVDTNEYIQSCFDRGHQIPSKDRTDTPFNNAQTFFTSNILPQTPYLNRVIWEHLEQYTRDLVQQQGKRAFVISGPVYDEDFGAIGPNHDIQVPSKNFKIVFVLNANQTAADINSRTEVIAVMMPNVMQDGSKPDFKNGCPKFNYPYIPRSDDWQKYKTTVQEIEKATGLHFVSLAN